MPEIKRIEFTECSDSRGFEGNYELCILLEESDFEYDFIVEPTFLRDLLEPEDITIPCLSTPTDTITKSGESISFKYSNTPSFTLPLEEFMAYLLLE